MTVLRPRIDWRSLDRAALGEAYNSAAAVANMRRHHRLVGTA